MTDQAAAIAAVRNQPGPRGTGRRLAAASAAAAVLATAGSELTWATESGPLGTVAVSGPLAGPLSVTLLSMVAAMAAALLTVCLLRGAHTGIALVLVFGTAAVAGSGALLAVEHIGVLERNRLAVGPGGWLALSALGASAALALLVGSALYEGSRAGRRPSRELAAAVVRVQAALPPPTDW